MLASTRASIRNPWATLAIAAALTAFFAVGSMRVQKEYGYRVLVGDEHPAIQQLDQLIEDFGGGYPTFIVWDCDGSACNSVFDEASLRMAEAVSRQMQSAPGVMDVIGPHNATIVLPTEDGFALRRFIEHGEIVSDADALAERVSSDETWLGWVISHDGRAGVLTVQAVSTETDVGEAIVDAALEAIAPYEAQGFEFALVGHMLGAVVAGRDLSESTSRIIPFMVVVIGICLLLLTRSLAVTGIALVTMGVALVWTKGALGWLGWPQDSILEVLAPLILVIGVCDAVHLLSAYARELGTHRPGDDTPRRSAILDACRAVARPCVATTLTTAGAFLSFLTSGLDTFVRFGSIAAIGVSFCLILTFTLLPALTLVAGGSISAAQPVRGRTWTSLLSGAVSASWTHTRPILLVSLCALLLGAYGWSQLRVDTDWRESFGEKNRVARWIATMSSRIRPTDTLEVSVTLPEGETFAAPDSLNRVEALGRWLETLDGLRSATGIQTLMSRLNRALHEDSARFERPGETLEANAELLEMLSSENPQIVAQWLSVDWNRLRLSVGADGLSFKTRSEILDRAKRYAEQKLPADWKVEFGGPFALYSQWMRDVQGTQLRSFPTALAIVFVLVALFLRSVRLAALAIVPVVVPVVVTLGTMGAMGMSLDIGRAMVAAVVVGIAVDDGIHILTRYRAERENGRLPRAAIHQAILETGPAVITTSIALALGFLTLMVSAWQSISSLGFFVALAILGALVATLVLIPAIVSLFADEAEEPVHSEVSARG